MCQKQFCSSLEDSFNFHFDARLISTQSVIAKDDFFTVMCGGCMYSRWVGGVFSLTNWLSVAAFVAVVAPSIIPTPFVRSISVTRQNSREVSFPIFEKFEHEERERERGERERESKGVAAPNTLKRGMNVAHRTITSLLH